MTKISHIAWKELRTYFTSWMAYAVLAGWLFISGLLFVLMLQTPQNFQLAGIYPFLITVLLFIAPLITMRLVAEERNIGTLEMLFTSPLTEWQVTLGKFFGAWAFIATMLLLTVHFPIIATRFGSIDTGPVWGSYIALLCVGAAFVAFGLFCSSLTDNQVVAGFLTFGGLLLSWMLSFVPQAAPTSTVAEFIGQWSVFTHFVPMMQGAVDSRDLIFFASLVVLFLFATVRVLESRKWR
jgi:ABC-2 type transport system permease protein